MLASKPTSGLSLVAMPVALQIREFGSAMSHFALFNPWLAYPTSF